MKALILAAGQGKRLLPLTEDRPKAMLDVGGNSMIGWQVDALAAKGVDDIVVVTGFRAEVIGETLSALREVQNAARAISDLAREIERSPNSLIFGR